MTQAGLSKLSATKELDKPPGITSLLAAAYPKRPTWARIWAGSNHNSMPGPAATHGAAQQPGSARLDSLPGVSLNGLKPSPGACQLSAIPQHTPVYMYATENRTPNILTKPLEFLIHTPSSLLSSPPHLLPPRSPPASQRYPHILPL